MLINCEYFVGDPGEIKLYNISDHLINSLDIYFISEDAETYYNILTPYDDNTPKLIVEIDGIEYPIKEGVVGESPFNPIKYSKSEDISKIIFRNQNNDIIATAFAGSNNSAEGLDWDINTNINVDDFITIKIISTRPSPDSTSLFGYGVYGYGDDPEYVIGYGGYGENSELKNIILSISESSDNKYPYNYIGT